MSVKKEKSKSLFSWISSKSSSLSTNTNDSPNSIKSPKGKAERFSFSHVTQHIENDPLSLRKSLEEGLKLTIRVDNTSKNCFGFDNCIMWLKGKTLEVWKPSAGENIIIPLNEITSIRVNNEDFLLFIKLKHSIEYEFKVPDQIKLQQLRLLLKASTAQILVSDTTITPISTTTTTTTSSITPTSPSILSTNTITSVNKVISKQNTISLSKTDNQILGDDTTTNDENEEINHIMEESRKKIATSTQKLSLRVPNLTSPGCANDRAGARQRLRSRSIKLSSNAVSSLTDSSSSELTSSSTETVPHSINITTPLKLDINVDINVDVDDHNHDLENEVDKSFDELYDTLLTSKHSPKRKLGEIEDDENNENDENVGNISSNKNTLKLSPKKIATTTTTAPSRNSYRLKGSPTKRSQESDVIVSNETISL